MKFLKLQGVIVGTLHGNPKLFSPHCLAQKVWADSI